MFFNLQSAIYNLQSFTSFADLFRALVFVTLVAAVYACAFGVIARKLRSRGTEPLFGHCRDRAILILAAVGIACFAWALLEPYRVEVTYVRVPFPGIAVQNRVRLVQISDVHSGTRPRLEESLPDIIARQSPDLIVFTGDALNAPNGIRVFKQFITRVSNIAPTYAVRGNWDAIPGAGANLFRGTSVRELDGEFVDVEVRGQRLRLVGARFGETLRMEQAVRAARTTLLTDVAKPVVDLQAARTPVIALAHSPDFIKDAKGTDLLLAGHTHGGQIRLPWYGALITLTTTGKRYESGLHRDGRTWIYTNRGIGVEPLFPVRFLCRPEVTVIDLVAER